MPDAYRSQWEQRIPWELEVQMVVRVWETESSSSARARALIQSHLPRCLGWVLRDSDGE